MNVEVKNTITTSTKPSNTSPVSPSSSQNDDVNFANELSNLSSKKIENIDKVNEVEKDTQKETQIVQTEIQTTQTEISLQPEQNQVNEKPITLLEEDTPIEQKPITLPLENEINNLLKINTKPVELDKSLEEPQVIQDTKELKIPQEPIQQILQNEIENHKPEEIIEPTANTIKVETQPVLNKITPEPVIEKVSPKPAEEKAENTKPSISLKEDEETPPIEEVISGLSEIVKKINTKLTQKEDKIETEIKKPQIFDDNKAKKEDKTLLNNDMNIQDVQTDALAFQMSANMNFNSNGQPFSEFMGNQKEDKLKANASDIAEEKAILSSMDENIAIANRNKAAIENNAKIVEPQVKTVIADDGIKKVDKKTNITVETVVKFDNVIMDKNDVEFFAKLVENQQAEITQETVKSLNVSKTLADLISKSMKDNQPIRIDFDNNISVIIKISKDGKISADFLPSSQVAEAYLKENLPILRQKFDDNNINYDELNHRKHKQDNKDNQKKGRKDE